MVQLDEAVGCWWYLGVRLSYQLNPYKLYIHKQETYIYATCSNLEMVQISGYIHTVWIALSSCVMFLWKGVDVCLICILQVDYIRKVCKSSFKDDYIVIFIKTIVIHITVTCS